jgi:hypothetical protein
MLKIIPPSLFSEADIRWPLPFLPVCLLRPGVTILTPRAKTVAFGCALIKQIWGELLPFILAVWFGTYWHGYFHS